MKNSNLLLFIVLLVSSLSTAHSSGASFQVDQTFVHVLNDDIDGISFEVTVPLESLRTEIVEIEGEKYSEVSIIDWVKLSEPGAPSLPFLTEIIGVPFDSKLEINFTPLKSHEILLSAPVLPAITQSVDYGSLDPRIHSFNIPKINYSYEKDPLYYSNKKVYPNELVQVSNDGLIRQQRIAGISIYPVQFNPENDSLTFYETIHVEINFNRSAINRESKLFSDNPVYESFFETNLLNYESSKYWRQPFEEQTYPSETSIENLLQSRQVSSWSPPENSWRITICESGIYELSYNDLLEAGVLDTSPNPDYFQMFYEGEEIAIEVNSGGNSVFTIDDKIIFYAEEIESKYTSENVYWLTIGKVPGRRMKLMPSETGTAEFIENYSDFLHLEENPNELLYMTNIPGNDDLERFMWDYLYPPSRPLRSYTFTLTAPVLNEPAITRIALLGYMQDYSVYPDHHVEVQVNGQFIGEAFWDGMEWEILELDIPPDVLTPGNNTITLNAPNDLGLETDVIYLDWIEIEYRNRFVSEVNKIDFDLNDEGDHRIKIDGFTEDAINAYDTTDPFNVKKLDGGVIEGTNPYSFIFQNSLLFPTRYFVTADSALLTVISITKDNFSNLRSEQNSAENIIISHSHFMDSAEILADFRNENEMPSILIDIQDVYDEFGFGVNGNQPIKDFLSYAYANWSNPRPASVLLIGDGHYDPKNYLGFNRISYIPPFLSVVDPWRGETAADNRYVTIRGDDSLPDMMIGRLSVNSLEEAETLINKIINYEEDVSSGDWQNHFLAVADNPDSGGNFPYYSDRILEDSIPDEFLTSKVYYGVTHLDIGDAKDAIIDYINEGTAFVNYTGHAYYAGWGAPTLLTTGEISGLINGNMLPIVLSMTCNDGFFHYPNPYSAGRESMAEVFTRRNGGGSIANWSPTGMGLATGHEYLNKGFLEAVFFGGANTIGEATLAGKLNLWATGTNLDLLDTYTLFGDPITTNIFMLEFVDNIYLPIIFADQ